MKKDNSYHAVVHIMKAAVYAKAGFHQEAHSLAMKAQHHAEAHRSELASTGKHADVQEFDRKIAPMFSHLQEVLSKAPSPAQPAKKPSLMSRVKEAISPSKPLKKANVYPSIMHALDAEHKQTVNRSPGKRAGFDYKPFSDLSPESKNKARMAFRTSPDKMENYHYAHNQATGQLDVGHRWLQPKAPPQATPGAPTGAGKNPPQATAAAIAPTGMIMPHHMPGAAVTIMAPGHDHHGAFGEVQHPNPLMPGQIKVKVKNKQTKRLEDTYVQPHQVQMNNPLKRSESGNVVLLEKSRAALKRIKSPKES